MLMATYMYALRHLAVSVSPCYNTARVFCDIWSSKYNFYGTTWFFQGQPDDDVIKMAYSSVFFISYYNREHSEKYQQFLKSVKTGSAKYFSYNYTEDEEVSKRRVFVFREHREPVVNNASLVFLGLY